MLLHSIVPESLKLPISSSQPLGQWNQLKLYVITFGPLSFKFASFQLWKVHLHRIMLHNPGIMPIIKK